MEARAGYGAETNVYIIILVASIYCVLKKSKLLKVIMHHHRKSLLLPLLVLFPSLPRATFGLYAEEDGLVHVGVDVDASRTTPMNMMWQESIGSG